MPNIDLDEGRRKHFQRVERLGCHRRRVLEMSAFVAGVNDPRASNVSDRLRSCHTYLLFHDHYEEGVVRLKRTVSCRLHLLCPLCAIIRAGNGVQRYEERCRVIREANPSLRLYYVVLTVRNGADLHERFEHVETAARKLVERRRAAVSAGNGRKQFAYALGSVLAGVAGGAYSFEVKRGKGSKEWHPHVNLLLLSADPIDRERLEEEWCEVTGDSFITYCEEMNPDDKTAFVEVFKYAMKFSEMTCQDTFHAYQILRGRRLFGSFGAFRGVEVPEIADCDLDSPYIEMLYRYGSSGYRRVPSMNSQLPVNEDSSSVLQPLIEGSFNITEVESWSS